MKVLRDEYNGKIPTDFKSILSLPGSEEKCQLIMGDVLATAIVTDTHCIRLVNRIGLVDGIKDPKKLRWHYGRSFHQKKEVISATGWYGMEEMSVRQEQSLIVRDVV